MNALLLLPGLFALVLAISGVAARGADRLSLRQHRRWIHRWHRRERCAIADLRSKIKDCPTWDELEELVSFEKAEILRLIDQRINVALGRSHIELYPRFGFGHPREDN